MPDPEAKRDSSISVQIIVAVIGLVGVIATAVIGNWDKIFPPQGKTEPAVVKERPPRNGPKERPVHSRGRLVVRGTWMYDLDSGVEASAGAAAGADFQWEQATDVKRYIAPLNGAVFFVVGIREFTSVTYTELEHFPYSSRKIDGSNLPSNQIPRGTIVAYKTNEGRLGKFIVDEYGYNLTISWVTLE